MANDGERTVPEEFKTKIKDRIIDQLLKVQEFNKRCHELIGSGAKKRKWMEFISECDDWFDGESTTMADLFDKSRYI